MDHKSFREVATNLGLMRTFSFSMQKAFHEENYLALLLKLLESSIDRTMTVKMLI